MNPLRGQNNVQGACDMGSFPHELAGYRHISLDEPRAAVREGLERHPRQGARPAHPEHARRRGRGHVQGHLHSGRGHPAVRSRHQARVGGLEAMECVVVQDLFLNETARFAHVFLPGSTFLEKDGTFTNAERRIQRVRKVMSAEERLRRLGDHADALQGARLRDALQPSIRRSWTRIARLTPGFRQRVLPNAGGARVGAVALQREGARGLADHAREWLCAWQGQVHHHRIRGDRRERTGPRFPLLLTTGRILSQYNVGAQTRRTANSMRHSEDVLEIHPHDAEQRGVRDGDWVRLKSRAGETSAARADHRSRSRRAWSTPRSTIRTRRQTSSRRITRTGRRTVPEYKVTAVQISPSNGPSKWQEDYEEFSRESRRITPKTVPLEAAE